LQALYYSVLRGQRALILADDTSDAAQVRPLIPPAGCALLVTSRLRFTLPGMVTLDLEQLGEEEAVQLLRALCARLNMANAQALARMCGYLPLALRTSGSSLRNDRALHVATYLACLVDTQQRLTQLSDPDDPQLDVAASLALSYAQLDEPAQQIFRQLGVFVADFATEMAT
jgi:predicted ATPase